MSSESCSSILGAVIMIHRPSPDSSLYTVGDKGTGCAEGEICDRNLRPSSLGRDMRSATAGTCPGGVAKLSGEWSPQSRSLNAAAAREIAQPTTGRVVVGKRKLRRFLSGRQSNTAGRLVQPADSLRKTCSGRTFCRAPEPGTRMEPRSPKWPCY